MGSTMKNKIHTIEVENNEKESVKKILENINDKKITYIKNKSYKTEEILETIDITGPAIISVSYTHLTLPTNREV